MHLPQDLWSHTDNGTAVRNVSLPAVPPHGVVALLLRDAGDEPAGIYPECSVWWQCTDAKSVASSCLDCGRAVMLIRKFVVGRTWAAEHPLAVRDGKSRFGDRSKGSVTADPKYDVGILCAASPLTANFTREYGFI
jgi:hypothetical protein